MISQAGQPISFEDGISRKDLTRIRERFLKLHRVRLERMLGELSGSKQELIQLLPLLFHINHPLLPGYVNSETPHGIPNYTPPKRVLDTAHKYSRSFQYKRRAQRLFQIEGLYLMGSTGTIAQSSSSDFDIWLCHAPNLGGKMREQLQQKADLVEQTALARGLEVHIFLVDAEEFRSGRKAKLSPESSGSTQHSLLLEEFYRSAVLLAGRFPLWWLVPPEHEIDYRRYADHLLLHRFIKAGEVLDLGGLEEVPADEFFGSALWQLYKGIDSPYKSILKILLMEAYSRDYPHPHWLAQQAKEAIYAGVNDPDQLDAYILLYRRVDAYLRGIDDPDRLDLARRCFYFKVGEPLSRVARCEHWRRKALFQLTREWGWSQVDLQMLDARASWKIDLVIKERNLLVRVLSRSYRLLTDFARNYSGRSRIDPKELHLLGRKLYTALDHRPGKVDFINPGISSNLLETHLSLHRRPSREGSLAWMLYRGMVDEVQACEQRPIKITSHLIELLLWSHVNQVWGPHTLLSLYPEDCAVSRRELLELHRSLANLFTCKAMQVIDMKVLAQPAVATRVALFINIGTDPFAQLSRSGKQLTSNQHDPLCFSSAMTNLAIDLEELVETSWGELLVVRREGEAGLLDALCNILNMQAVEGAKPPEIHAYSFSSVRGRQIAERVDELFHHVMQYFHALARGDDRYAFRLGREYFLVQREQHRFTWSSLESFEGLLEDLIQPYPRFRGLSFDPEILQETPYPTLYRLNRPGIIQLFYQTLPQQMQIFVLDEHGALFQHTLAMDSPRYLMLQQRRFLNSLQQLHSLMSADADIPLNEPEFYELRHESYAGWSSERCQVPLLRPDDYLELTLITDRLDFSAQPLALVCGDREFSRLEYGDELYQAVVQHLLALRAGNADYPIYLTSLRFTGLQILQPPSTVTLLELKKRIESHLNKARRMRSA